MRIAVLGTGDVGGSLGKRWAQKGHIVIFGSRNPHDDKVHKLLAEAGPNSRAAGNAEAAAEGEVTVLATPWNAAKEVVLSVGNWKGRILIDCTNPLTEDLQLAVGKTTSAAEKIASWARGARVVKAFNTTGWNNMADPAYPNGPISMFIAGDDPDAKAVASRLAEDLSFEPVDSGGLAVARFLEPLALLWIHLAVVQNLGRDIAFRLIRR
jgi:NADPH-dependent F420 reductase